MKITVEPLSLPEEFYKIWNFTEKLLAEGASYNNVVVGMILLVGRTISDHSTNPLSDFDKAIEGMRVGLEIHKKMSSPEGIKSD